MATKIDNYVSGQPLLAQLKQQLHSQTPRAEGVVKPQKKALASWKSTRKKVISSAAADEKSHAWRPNYRGDPQEKERESAEPEELVEPFLTRLWVKFRAKMTVWPSFLIIHS